MFKQRLKPFTIVLSAVLATLFLYGCTVYPTGSSARVYTQTDNVSLSLAFNDYDRSRIFHYYGYPHRGRKPLPPGHYKRFERHKPLPPGFYPRPLPSELDHNLSPLPSGYIRVIIGDDIAIMNTRTRVIYDVLWGIR